MITTIEKQHTDHYSDCLMIANMCQHLHLFTKAGTPRPGDICAIINRATGRLGWQAAWQAFCNDPSEFVTHQQGSTNWRTLDTSQTADPAPPADLPRCTMNDPVDAHCRWCGTSIQVVMNAGFRVSSIYCDSTCENDHAASMAMAKVRQ